jgi:hypothetical protein
MKPIKDIMEKFSFKYDGLLDSDAKLTHGYIARAMVLASMPHSETKETSFKRENGNYKLSLIADPDIGLPYGSIPRLIFAWMTTEAVIKKNRELILGKSLASFMRQLDIEPTGGRKGTITALREQMRRLFNTTISCTYSDVERDSGTRMVLVENYDLWWEPKDPNQRVLWNSTVILSEKFFNEITNNPVIFYMGALKTLRKSPLALDIYMWLTYKNSYSANPLTISVESLMMQFGAGYPNDARGKADFKRKFKEALKKVAATYPEARKLKFSTNGLQYMPGSPHVPKQQKLSYTA